MLNKRFMDTIAGFIASRKLLSRGSAHIAALSGGADSVAMTLALKQLGYAVEAAHCNFHLRGDESDRDEKFCQAFCAENNIPLHIAHFDTTGFAGLHKISIEMAARKLRYSYFERLRSDIGAGCICVAHHRDDTVETVLMNLIRGTGIHGLTGISCRNGSVVRPLLCVFRRDIESALREVGQPYVTDSTNLEDDVVRNKIRLNIIPMMRGINPSASESIAATAERMTDAAKMFDAAVSEAAAAATESLHGGSVAISLDCLLKAAAPETVLFSILKGYAFTPSQVEQVFSSISSETGKTFISPTHQLLVDRGRLIIEPKVEVALRPMRIPETGVYTCPGGARLRFELVSADGFMISKSRDQASLDASRATFPLTVRPAMQGDRFTPFGMSGSKSVSDYLTDRKRTLFEKRRQLVITDPAGRIIWLVGERPDNRCRITATTRQILRITLL